MRIEIDEPLEKAPEACHCTQCRKQTGNFFVGVNVRRTALRVSAEDRITWYQSSENVQRGFCSCCGAALFWKPTFAGYEWTAVMLGCRNDAGLTWPVGTGVDWPPCAETLTTPVVVPVAT